VSFLCKGFLSLFIGLSLALGLVACSLILPSTAGPTAPCSVTNSKQAADRLSQRIKQATQSKRQTITITATSEEISSLLNEFIEQSKQNSPGGFIPLENPVVCFKNGQMSIFGTIKLGGTNSINALLSIVAAVNNGKAAFRVVQVEVGSFSAPQGLGDAVSGLLNDALNQGLDRIHLTEIKIQDDQMTLSGKLQ
jgi:hypothetical protein